MADLSSKPAGYTPPRSPRGPSLACKGWRQEGILRLLLNSVDPEVAERPAQLTPCGALGKAAADWQSFQAIAESLGHLDAGETLEIKDGKAVRTVRGNAPSPQVISIDSGALAGNWLYVGPQTALPALYEAYSAAALRHFERSLAGRLVLGIGLGGFGGAQALAAVLNGAAFLGIDADAETIKRRVKTGYCEVMVNQLDEALRILKNAVRKKQAASAGLLGNSAELLPALAERGIVPDLITDFTPPSAGGYLPAGFTADTLPPAGAADFAPFARLQAQSVARQTEALSALRKLGSRLLSPPEYLQETAALGLFPVTWIALSGERADIAAMDRLAGETFPRQTRLLHWLSLAQTHVRFQGLPARVAWLSVSDSQQLLRAANQLVSRKGLSAPILFGWNFLLPGLTPEAVSPPAWIAEIASWTCLHADAGAGQSQLVAAAVVAEGT